ncbi:RES family NAD+ phosphorylase [Actibacterium sp. 188UL27-1]|uniref:RES family NAD+ phosphorylase n=1 Tax=Actibacterium sp. 188UL27-1 TaxID=2786961 RepID=UPI00195EDA34|nr:RES family NAD+ phosphorylase [Actibacterium sp. 188UL27-1]
MGHLIQTKIAGRFVKITFPDTVDLVLRQGLPHRPPARFNRSGQDALYLSCDETSAKAALRKYIRKDDPPRVLVTYAVERCWVVDLRHPETADLYEQARQPWKAVLDAGETPASWEAADRIRAEDHSGLIDPSRQSPGLWHLTLFRWNASGGPSVRQIHVSEPMLIR